MSMPTTDLWRSCGKDIQAVPHTGIYKRGVSPSTWPKAYLPNVPSLVKISKKWINKKQFNTLGYQYDSGSINFKLVEGRNRVQVGATNRWRLSTDTGSDLLATTQVIKATHIGSDSDEIYYSSIPSSTKICDSMKMTSVFSFSQKPKFVSSNSTFGFKNFNQVILPKLRPKVPVYHTKCDRMLPLEKDIYEMQMHSSYVPFEKRTPTAYEIFIKKSQEYHNVYGTEIVLYALDTEWELSQDVIDGSQVLCNLVNATNSKETSNSIQGFNNISGGQQCTKMRNTDSFDDEDTSKSSELNKRSVIYLTINNPLVTREVFSIVLLSLYKDVRFIPYEAAVNVLITAQLLKVTKLVDVCTYIMLDNIQINTVALYHNVAEQYSLDRLAKECFSWLELYLIPVLSSEIYLGHLSDRQLYQILKSPRFFTFNEYSVFMMLSYWIFLKEQKQSSMPSWSTVVTWFTSKPNSKAFLSTPEGRCYKPLFKLLRLNGIMNPAHVLEVRKMNLLPVQWLLTTLENHYYSLQNGGDMNLMTRFESGSIRYGFILKKNITVHSEILHIHGFYFELMCSRNSAGCTCSLKRLRPNNSSLSFRTCERQTFSIRQDREIRYSIKVQWKSHDQYYIETLGPTSQIIGFGEGTSESKKLCANSPNTDLFVTIALILPPS